MSEKSPDFNGAWYEMTTELSDLLSEIDQTTPVLIAGPTASGKSALALEIVEAKGGVILNADALQVFADWRILTARPPDEDLSRAPHHLYGHIPGDQAYSVGAWLRDVALHLTGPRPIIVGGTGLYFMALTEGLADIPETPAKIRASADAILAVAGISGLLASIDKETASRIDLQNPMRVQRAWEVQRTTGRGLASWQDDTGPALLPEGAATRILIDAPKDWLTPRIERRFDLMLEMGVLDEARANAETWHRSLPSAKAIGAEALISHVNGQIDLDTAKTAVVTLSRQYAKRQRSWFRARMKGWRSFSFR